MKRYKMNINGQRYDTHVVEYNKHSARIIVNDVEYEIEFDNEENDQKQQIVLVNNTIPLVPEMKAVTNDSSDVKAPIPGLILSIQANEGQRVKVGDVLFILEAMKMESEICAPIDGTVEQILVKEKASVQEGDVLLKLTSDN